MVGGTLNRPADVAVARTDAAGRAVRIRLESIDVLRGIVMMLMALDHVREFLGYPSANPTDPATTTLALFFTRWITHICAPVFFLLTGTGAFLARSGRSDAALSRFLLIRGAWLIGLEIVVVRCFGFQFNVDYRVTLLTVLWALGWSMIALAVLVHLPARVVGALGVVMIATHNLFDGVRASSLGALAPLWTMLHAPGVVLPGPHLVFAAYPLVPWIGVAAAGYGLGQIYAWPGRRPCDAAGGRPVHPSTSSGCPEPVEGQGRRNLLWRIGLGLTAAFVLLRALNIYGDPQAWTPRTSAAFTVLSFLNTSKYPPSLLFLMMTLGPALCLLSVFDRGTPRVLRPAAVFGRVPLFYFLVHLPLIHLLAVAVCAVQYGDAHWMFESPILSRYPFTQPPGWGFGLPAVYLIWAGVVVVLYPLCRWFAELKQRRADAWLRYL